MSLFVLAAVLCLVIAGLGIVELLSGGKREPLFIALRVEVGLLMGALLTPLLSWSVLVGGAVGTVAAAVAVYRRMGSLAEAFDPGAGVLGSYDEALVLLSLHDRLDEVRPGVAFTRALGNAFRALLLLAVAAFAIALGIHDADILLLVFGSFVACFPLAQAFGHVTEAAEAELLLSSIERIEAGKLALSDPSPEELDDPGAAGGSPAGRPGRSRHSTLHERD